MENKVISDLEILIPEDKENCEVRISKEENNGSQPKLYIESYGCQMNFSDSEIVTSILQKEANFGTTSSFEDADLILLNTCSIRDKAEQTIRKRLKYFNKIKKKRPDTTIGILGCMAERLKKNLLEEEKMVDLVVGPDAYRDLPNLVGQVNDGQKAVNVLLSREETYADISPVRLNSNGVTAYISIMRGCDNVCAFCVVPFTRGRERSRDPQSIVNEAKDLFEKGYKEVTLLGQNVDSYRWTNIPKRRSERANFTEEEKTMNFAQLLEQVALVSPELRVRFSTSHPKDMGDDVLEMIAKYENICNFIHLPVQSGNSRVLKMMNRTYDREWYIDRIKAIRRIIGDHCGVSSDMIAGFCSETEEEHQDTLSLMDYVKYDSSFMFYYSERPGTFAAKKFLDDVPLEVKKRRLQETIDKQMQHSLERNQEVLNKVHKVLVEGFSKRSDEKLVGRTSENRVVIFPKENYKKGDYVNVYVTECTSITLFGEAVKDQ